MGRPKGSKNKPKEMKGNKKVGRPKRNGTLEAFELEEDRIKLQHSMDRVPMLSDDGYRLKETVGLLKIFGYTSKEIRKFLIDGTIPLK